jgi:hypothetical protein
VGCKVRKVFVWLGDCFVVWKCCLGGGVDVIEIVGVGVWELLIWFGIWCLVEFLV